MPKPRTHLSVSVPQVGSAWNDQLPSKLAHGAAVTTLCGYASQKSTAEVTAVPEDEE